MQGRLNQRVEALRGQLSATALRVADYLVEHPEHAAEASAITIAERVGTSDATVVRTVKQLGYDGLSDLRQATKAEWALTYNPRAVLQERVESIGADAASVLELLVEDAVAILRESAAANSATVMSEATEALCTARAVVVVGFGRAGSLADHFSLGLARIGRAARAATAAGFRLADELAELGCDDALVLVAPLRYTREIKVAINHAHAVGARIVLVTETLGERLREEVTVALNTASTRHRLANETLATMAVLDALLLGVASRDKTRALQRWTTINHLRAELAGTGMDLPRLLPDGDEQPRSAARPGRENASGQDYIRGT